MTTDKPKKTKFTRGTALLHEDVVTPMHHHNESDNELIVEVDGRKVSMDACQADGFVTERFDQPELYEVEHVEGGPRGIKRRHVLQGVAAGFGAMLTGSALPRYSFGGPKSGKGNHLLVCVFLRGGFDGLSAVSPLKDSNLMKVRPTIAVRPEDAINLDGTWGLNPNMKAMHDLWKAGELAIIQGSGTPDVTRSHFRDQATIERAAPANVRSGWLGRHLQSSTNSTGVFRGITIGYSTVFSLSTESVTSLAISSLAAFDLRTYGNEQAKKDVRKLIEDMYGSSGGTVQQQAELTFEAVDSLKQIREKKAAEKSAGAAYPKDSWGRGLSEIAQIAKAGLGVEVACIDLSGWDMHSGLGSAKEENDLFSRMSRRLSEGIAAFRQDLGDLWENTTVVTMSEFGRRVAENGNRGLDHGQGNTMFVAGGGINGKKVHGSVPTLVEENLSLGDVPITLDYRQALSEIVSKQLGNTNVAEVFPGFTPGKDLGIV